MLDANGGCHMRSSFGFHSGDGKWIFRWGGKEYDTGKSTLIWEIDIGEGNPHYVGQTLYRTDKNHTFFVVSRGYFFGEYSKEETRR